MKLSSEEVRHIAELARLKITPEEETLYAGQLSAILEYAERLARVDTSGIPPTASVLPLTAPLRPDEPRSPMVTRDLLANATRTQDNRFQVPPVLDLPD
ncbi:MAG: Asp-tRNA(Asn)/Glu-tRNA(Gln) amidotransferase subunit GatC [Anaerolineales bacterium]|nr:Asp-tRNA(Asn)/Glu-tRNA(Gln) amidotransferase subunit GatC [Anaerolineales bacterium]